eukprot:1543696-Pyramimonas_sp.AAC.1
MAPSAGLGGALRSQTGMGGGGCLLFFPKQHLAFSAASRSPFLRRCCRQRECLSLWPVEGIVLRRVLAQ